MATFSSLYALAVHVLPLHALKEVWAKQVLLGKKALADRPETALRPTTHLVDQALGFDDFVHFYLFGTATTLDVAPLLGTQLGSGQIPPFPHVALELATEGLPDEICAICLWNIAVSRPAVVGVCKGGNWARGTSPSRIAEVWRAFRVSRPTTERARGYWNDPWLVPTLRGSQIAEQQWIFHKAPRGVPELLLRSPIAVDGRFTLWVFSRADLRAVEALEGAPAGLRVQQEAFPGYCADAPQTRAWRERIVQYFVGSASFPADLDFDAPR